MNFERLDQRLDWRSGPPVGAFARRLRRRRILIALAGIGLIAAAAAVYAALRPVQGTTADSYSVAVRCRSCGHVAEVAVAHGQRFPIACPRCGMSSAHPLWRCRDCGATFAPSTADGEIVRCPRCGGARVGSAVEGAGRLRRVNEIPARPEASTERGR